MPATRPAATGPATQAARPLRVLFVGNSYTYCNELPLMLEAFGRAAGRPIQTHQSIAGGWTLAKHWQAGRAQKAIAEGKWDCVVLQEQSQLPIVRPRAMHKYVRLFDREIRKTGARTVLFLTWARRGKGEQQAALTKSYTAVAKEVGAVVVPVGPAWQQALTEKPALVLHEKDDSHPTAVGSYLAACVFWAVLTGKSPEGLPGKIVVAGRPGREPKKITLADLNKDEAAFFQRIARRAAAAFPPTTTRPAEKPRQ